MRLNSVGKPLDIQSVTNPPDVFKDRVIGEATATNSFTNVPASEGVSKSIDSFMAYKEVMRRQHEM